LRDQLKGGLSATPHEPDEPGPTDSELADRIKALKGANTIEGAPHRVQRQHASAEEPITARIRRRQEAMPMADQTVEHDGALQAASATPKPNSSAKPMTFQARILRERNVQPDRHTSK
jgi:hypothetical protein